MIYQKLIETIEKNADVLTKEIVSEIQKLEETTHYRTLPQDVVYDRVHRVFYNVYRKLGNWLSKDKPKNVVFAYYSEVGRERLKENIPLQEVILILQLIRRKLWDFVILNRVFDSGYGLNQVLELNSHVAIFFDSIIYATVSGYENEMKYTVQKNISPSQFSKIYPAETEPLAYYNA
ncbi:MAG: hypothetical protein JW920_01725 [Deltaproteobacteria bacterium]|nr:hypothetical protein [Deltaproteobacteria bacterium]